MYPKLHAGDRVQVIDADSPYANQFGAVAATDLGGGPAAAAEIIRVRLDPPETAHNFRRRQLSDAIA